jgi:hypothetical protein
MHSRWLLLPALAITLTNASSGEDKYPLDAPAFSIKSADVLQAAKAGEEPKDVDVEMLFEEHRYQLDAEGREHRTVHRIFRYLTDRGVEDWCNTEADWCPSCEEKPVIRARVITSDGVSHELDPESIAEVSSGADDHNMFSDQKLLRAPLPAIEVGAVVEEEIINREQRPLFDRGLVERFQLTDTHPVRQLRLVIEAPTSLPLQYEVLGSELRPTRSEHDGKVTLRLDTGPMPAQEPPEPYMPPDVCRWPQIVFSTGKSWGEVANRYTELVEPQLDTKAVASLVHDAVDKETDRKKIIAKLLGIVRTHVRYTGIEFGKGAIVPRTPAATLARRYGDCKDQSALLATMLRVAGIPAQLVLLRSGRYADVVPTLPGMGDFDHCIVYLPGQQPLWVDPTARCVPAGQLPLGDQGRWAMLADRQTRALVRTPKMDYRQNTSREVHEIFLTEEKKTRVRVTVSGTGSCDDDLREDYAGQNAKELRKAWREFFKGKYHAHTLAKLEYARPLDLSKPFHVVAEVSDARAAKYNSQDIALALRPDPLFERLPGLFKGLDSEAEEEDGPRVSETDGSERKSPLVLPEPHIREVEYHITPPTGFTAKTLPDNFEKHFGPATLSQHFQRGEGNLIIASYRIDTGPGTFTAAEVNALRQAITELGGNDGADPWEVKIPLEASKAATKPHGQQP